MSGSRRGVLLGLGLLGLGALGAFLDAATGWVTPAFDAIAHQFYEQPVLASIRRPSQLALVRVHLVIWTALVGIGLAAAPRLGRNGRRLWTILCVGYALRAAAWIAGGDLPLVPGDSCHYLEVATSIYRGEGPVKHYVESYFRDYPAIRRGQGVLDDWATPLYAQIVALAFRLTGVVPGRSLEATVAVAKGVSFVANLLCLPALYGFARRRFNADIALVATTLLAVLPVHVIYAGFALRESLVALTSLLAVWSLTEIWAAEGGRRWIWAVAAGVAMGGAILGRNTAMALAAGCGLFGLVAHGRSRLGPVVAWGVVTIATIAPWGWATLKEYGEPFYTYTKFFPYNFSWTVHHYEKGNTRPDQFYTAANAPEIARVKIKAVGIITVYSTMILGIPVVLGILRRMRRGAGETDRLVLWLFAVFVAATLVQVADVTQVAQLGRYYLPIYCLLLPTAAAGLISWAEESTLPGARPWLAAALVGCLWADPTWAYDASWFVKPYQMHLAGLRGTGDWIREHPEEVPPNARILAWFPWELRVTSDRTTVLFPRSYYPPHIERAMRDYGVTHVLWGSFEPPPHSDPETWGEYLSELRTGIGLTEERELYRSPKGIPYPVRLYRIGARP